MSSHPPRCVTDNPCLGRRDNPCSLICLLAVPRIKRPCEAENSLRASFPRMKRAGSRLPPATAASRGQLCGRRVIRDAVHHACCVGVQRSRRALPTTRRGVNLVPIDSPRRTFAVGCDASRATLTEGESAVGNRDTLRELDAFSRSVLARRAPNVSSCPALRRRVTLAGDRRAATSGARRPWRRK